jgi:hypothetical protein
MGHNVSWQLVIHGQCGFLGSLDWENSFTELHATGVIEAGEKVKAALALALPIRPAVLRHTNEFCFFYFSLEVEQMNENCTSLEEEEEIRAEIRKMIEEIDGILHRIHIHA